MKQKPTQALHASSPQFLPAELSRFFCVFLVLRRLCQISDCQQPLRHRLLSLLHLLLRLHRLQKFCRFFLFFVFWFLVLFFVFVFLGVRAEFCLAESVGERIVRGRILLLEAEMGLGEAGGGVVQHAGPRIYSCCNCRCHVSDHDDIISKCFQVLLLLLLPVLLVILLFLRLLSLMFLFWW